MKKMLSVLLLVIGILLMLVIASEPMYEVSAAKFAITKLVEILLFIGIVEFGKFARKKGWVE